MGTDSAYMAISGSSLEQVIKPDMIEKYRHGLQSFCTDDEIEADAQNHRFLRTCCSKHTKYDKCTPGLFKLKYQGNEMIGLCSKTYIEQKTKTVRPSINHIVALRLLNRVKHRKTKQRQLTPLHKIHEFKYSSKGVSKRHLRAPMTEFRHMLKTHRAESSSNHGFRVRDIHPGTERFLLPLL